MSEESSEAEVYVFEMNHKIYGFIGLQDDYIAGIFVSRDCRSAGIGKRLLDHVKAFHSTLTLNVYRKNSRAVSFYAREGFAVISENFDPDTQEVDLKMHWHSKNNQLVTAK